MSYYAPYYLATEDIEKEGFKEIKSTAELLIYLNGYGLGLVAPGTIYSVNVLTPDLATYLLLVTNDGDKVFYHFDIGQRVKKRIKLGYDNRQTTKSIR